jgi:hypothetical protein
MKHVHLLTILLLSCLVLTSLGCEMNWPGQDDDASDGPSTTSKTAPKQSAAPTNQGHNLTVRINGKATQPGPVVGGEQIWTAAPATAAPTLHFTANTDVLGPINQSAIAIHPQNGQAVVREDVWQYTGTSTLGPDKDIRLNRFTHITPDRQMHTNLPGLPAGNYRLILTVRGEKDFDHQAIDLTIE